MKLEYVSLLRIQHNLHVLPRGIERFQEYLRTITPDGQRLTLPSLVMMNPMGKEHVAAMLDALLVQDADGVAAAAVAELASEVEAAPGDFKVAVVVADDLRGGWTNRYDIEYTQRFRVSPPESPDFKLPRWADCYWINGILWSSELASMRAVREAIRMAVHRAAYTLQHGRARTLRGMLRQEGQVMARAGCEGPVLDPGDLAYTREVIAPYLDTTDRRLAMECLFGDEPGKTLGFTPRGLSPWAGLALARCDAQSILAAGC